MQEVQGSFVAAGGQGRGAFWKRMAASPALQVTKGFWSICIEAIIEAKVKDAMMRERMQM